MQIFHSNSPSQTEDIAKALASELKTGDVLAFLGGMGMGKTAFVRGLAQGLSSIDDVSSPTFALVHEYRGPIPIFHFDMFRITTLDDLYSIGFFDYLDREGICVIEWSENITEALPPNSIFVKIEKLSENEREICIWGGGRF